MASSMIRGAKRAAAAPPSPATKRACPDADAAASGPAHDCRRQKPKVVQQAGTVDLGEGATVDYLPRAFAQQEAAELLEQLRREPFWAQREVRVMGRSVMQPRLVAYCADPGLSYTYSGATLEPSCWPPVVLAIRQRLEQLLGEAHGRPISQQQRQQQQEQQEQQRQQQQEQARFASREETQQAQQQRAQPTTQQRQQEGCHGPQVQGGAVAGVNSSGAEGSRPASSALFNSCLLNWYRGGGDHLSWHSDNERLYGQQPTIASVSLGASREFLLRRNADPADKYSFRLGAGDVLVMRGTTQQHWMHSVPKRKGLPGDRISLTFRRVVRPEAPPSGTSADDPYMENKT